MTRDQNSYQTLNKGDDDEFVGFIAKKIPKEY